MCGICGIVYSDRSRPVSERQLLSMRDVLEHRGPDDAGSFIANGAALGSRRLAVLDLSERGHMPMSTVDRRYWITYNGEVYNFKELRRGLEARGYTFRSSSDTEVVLYLYIDEGPAMLRKLNGMFSFAVWDTQERKLFLARDRLGIKPLYYHHQPSVLYFASEEKSLFAAGVPAKFDTTTWEELLCFRYVAGEHTPFVGIKRLLPGHFLTWKDGNLEIRRWWHLMERVQATRENLPRQPLEWFKDTFDSAVDFRRISDVPVGVLLSGGLDSSSVAASLALQSSSRTASFTVRFPEADYDEGPLAKQVASHCNLDYNELTVSRDKLFDGLLKASWLNDEPLVHGNDLHLWAIARHAKPLVTVLLSGEGGDETLGGYVRYQPLRYPMLLNGVRPLMPWVTSRIKLNGRLGKLTRFLKLGSTRNFVLFNACDVLPSELESLGFVANANYPFRKEILAEAETLYPSEPMRQAMYSDQHTFLCSILDRNDRMTMGGSIECRVPFLDYRLVEGLAALPTSVLLAGNGSKPLLRHAIGGRLTKAIHKHRKWGFGVPWSRYLREVPELRDLLDSLPHRDPFQGGPFEITKLKKVIKEFRDGQDGHDTLIRTFIMIGAWYQACFLDREAKDEGF